MRTIQLTNNVTSHAHIEFIHSLKLSNQKNKRFHFNNAVQHKMITVHRFYVFHEKYVEIFKRDKIFTELAEG